ncbi:hemopexin repeat-containing protein [Streptomyces sp. NBC_00876]|uniref:hemopexin repeat-containing protein n=1 Tax=Streptomyces sp. NBC_00876 TaxID=2975853 RepID=UPI003868A1F8|nr:hemopexin repeat-containing protein [Streptomyces sp. NBC_00876]
MATRTAFFFRGGTYVRYDVNPSTGDTVDTGIYPRGIGDGWGAMPVSFRSDIDAAVTWPDAFVYFFKGSTYVRWDATADTVDANIYPRDIADGWTAFPASFRTGIDAAINWGDGNVYFFKGPKYIKYNIGADTVDANIYPRDTAEGWTAFPASFRTGIDAAINWGDGNAYFFKGPKYIKYDIAHDTVDAHVYPRDTAEGWTQLAGAGFTDRIQEAIEWPQAEVATYSAPVSFTACTHTNQPVVSAGRTFDMQATMRQAHPSLCACGEYRQYVRGDFLYDGTRKNFLLQDGTGVPPVPLLPRPEPGAADDNFREDGRPASQNLFTHVDAHYGHRTGPTATVDVNDVYQPFPRRTGCAYTGHDTPMTQAAPGAFIRIDVDFRGRVIDTCNGGAVLQQSDWTVKCEVPEP